MRPRPLVARTDKLKVVYIAGCGRSGSTLLSRVLGQADGLISVGELRLIWSRGLLANELCSCGTAFRQCPFWAAVFQDAYGGFDQVDTTRLQRFLAESIRTNQLLRLIFAGSSVLTLNDFQTQSEVLLRLYAGIRHVAGDVVIVDSSKLAAYGLLLGSLADVELYTIHLVRDSRAVGFSFGRTNVRVEAEGQQTFMNRKSPGQVALAWLQANILAEVLRIKTSKYLLVRYEDFTFSPAMTMTRIATFLEEDLGSIQFTNDCAVHLRNDHVASGNPMRFRHGELRIRVDNEWQAKMDARSRRTMTALTLPLLARYRYVAGRRGA